MATRIVNLIPTQTLASSHRLWPRVLDGLSSIWTGIGLMVAIIVYSALGSAVPPLRQYFELAESAWFGNWFFATLIVLFSLVLVIATVRRIRFNLVNLGVLTVHTGLLLLAGGALLYFGRKVEGDIMLEAPRVLVVSKARLSRGESPVLGSLIAAEGKQWETSMPMAGGHYHIRVEQVQHSGMTTAASVTLAVTSGDPAKTRTIELSQEDERSGRVDLNEQVMLALQGATSIDHFYHGDLMALGVKAGRTEASFPLDGLPRYRERMIPGIEEVYDKNGRVVRGERYRAIPRVDGWTMPLAVTTDDRVESSDWPVQIEVDGYLPYAELTNEPIPGGTLVDPVALVETSVNGRANRSWLAGMKPAKARESRQGLDSVEFRWLDSAASGPGLPAELTEEIAGRHVLIVEVKDKNVRKQYELSAGQELAVEGTDYRLKVDGVMPEWPLMTPGFEGARSPVAQISVSTKGKHYQRTVVDRFPQLSQDIDEQGKRHREGPYDPNLVLRYTDCSAHNFLIAAGPTTPATLIYTAPGGKRTVRPIKPGDTFSPSTGVSLVLREMIEKPLVAERPIVVPDENRQRNMGRNMSLVRVHIRSKKSDWSQHVWVPFTQYGYVNDQRPVAVQVPGFGPLTLTYGRQTEQLPGPITLEQMAVTFNPGRMSVRDWRSLVRVQSRTTGRIGAASVFLNHTCRFGGWTLFQSGAAQDHESWTILGIGNRIGIQPMTWGCVLIAVGLLYAFYVKPAIKARRKQQFASQARAGGSNGAATHGAGIPPANAPRPRRLITTGLLAVALFGLVARDAGAQTSPAAMPDDDVHRAVAGMPEADSSSAVQAASMADSGETLAGLRRMASKLDLSAFRLLVVQHSGRYETMEAWARDVVKTIHGDTKMDGLDPVVAALEIVFNAHAHIDRDILYLKDIGVRHDVSSYPIVLDDAARGRIRRTGLVSYRFLTSEAVAGVIGQLKTKVMMQRAMDRLDSALYEFEAARELLRIVPDATAQSDAPWYSLDGLAANLNPHGRGAKAVPDVDAVTAGRLMAAYTGLGAAWCRRDAESVNRQLSVLCSELPRLGKGGSYLSLNQRKVEAFYHRMDAFTWGWGIYIVALAVSIWAVVTRWRVARGLAMCIFLVAFLLHGAGLALRWYIIGRVPVANMFESVVASAFLGAAIALGLELRVLRAWQTVYLFPMAAAVVLEQSFRSPMWFEFAGVAALGLIIDMTYIAFRTRGVAIPGIAVSEPGVPRRGVFVLAASFLGFLSLALGKVVGSEITTIAGILDDVLLRIHTVLIITSYSLVTLAFGVANCYLVVRAVKHASAPARATLGCQVGAGIGLYLMARLTAGPLAPLSAGLWLVAGLILLGGITAWVLPVSRGLVPRRADSVRLAHALGGRGETSDVSLQWDGRTLSQKRPPDSPLLAGFDLSQMTLMNMANIGLFVGMILGAVWADYSWGRPWGWDPKEVFALTTWLIYAILIHVRYVTRDKGLWSAVVAVIGFAMMMFNWWAVNFYIVGLHSYA